LEIVDGKPREVPKESPMEEDSQPEPDYEAMDITYEYRNPREDDVSRRRRFTESGVL
jgi:hypothetical protein